MHPSLVAPVLTPRRVIDQLTVKPSLAYALRRVCQGYTGPCMDVRRSSDGVVVPIGFDITGELDIGALIAHVGANDGTVAKWYDQMGSTNHMTQGVGAQPRIVASGVLDKCNGRPAIYQNTGSLGYLSVTYASGNSYAISYSAQWLSDINGRILHDPTLPVLFGWQAGVYTRGYFANGFNYQQSNQDTNPHVQSVRVVSNSIASGFRDGTAISQDNVVAASAWSGFNTNGHVAGTPSECRFMELYVFGASANDSDLKILDTNQKQRFGVA